MAAIKTQESDASVAKFFATLKDPTERADAATLSTLFAAATKAEARMWGKNIVGFGHRLIAYAGGKTGEWMIVGFSPRKSAFALYLGRGVERYPEFLTKIGPYKTEGGCLYLKGLAAADTTALQKLVAAVSRDIVAAAPKAAAKPAAKPVAKAKPKSKSATKAKPAPEPKAKSPAPRTKTSASTSKKKGST